MAVGVRADGVFGNLTLKAVAERLRCAVTVRCVQHAVGAEVDGVIGKETVSKVAQVLGLGWPSQAEVRSGKSIFGKAGDESQLVLVAPAYPLYYEGRVVKHVRVHKLIAEHVQEIFKEVLEAYGIERIKELGLDQYSGSYNYRATRSGATMSMHSWGIALDFAAEKNAYSMKKPKASLSKPECEKWWEIWERHGAVSLGRAKNYDWMHVQFATL